jgi:hypothetical protein
VRHVEFARRRTFLAPRLDELAVLGELDDPGIGLVAVTIGDEDVAVRASSGESVGDLTVLVFLA